MNGKNLRPMDLRDRRFTTMLVGDVLINGDQSHGINDTKSMEIPKARYDHSISRSLFQRKNDKELLDQCDSQAYNQEMFGEISYLVLSASVIYTLYASPDNAEEVLEFISKHKEIGGSLQHSMEIWD